MDRRVQWTQIAAADLEQIVAYIAKDSPRYAAAFARRVLDAAGSLSRLPNRGRVVPEFGDQAIRETLVKDYRLIYRVTSDQVQILAIIHGARDLEGLWQRENRPLP